MFNSYCGPESGAIPKHSEVEVEAPVFTAMTAAAVLKWCRKKSPNGLHLMNPAWPDQE
jgi:hypothetical protein